MNLTAISHYISLILRHKPEVIGITLDEYGRAGYAFYLSANGVWLIKEVPVEFLQRLPQNALFTDKARKICSRKCLSGNHNIILTLRI